jgi:hypothetical protein
VNCISRLRSGLVTMGDLIPSCTDLRLAAYRSITGDAATYSIGRHGSRNPDRVDSAGLTKRLIHDAALEPAHPVFVALGADVGADPWNFPPSLRTMILKVKGHPEKGSRPIDDPSEYKRLVVLHVRHLLEHRIESNLTIGQYGGRPAKYIKRTCHRPGATAQDHVAGAIKQAIWDGYRYVVLLDLKDAFKLVPKQAAIYALTNLEIDQQAAEWLWRLVQIDAIHAGSKTRVWADPTMGIEQGNPLSSCIMNLVLAPIFEILEPVLGVRIFSYLDDIYVAAKTHQDALDAFNRFKQSARARGFTNVRRLWAPGDPADSKFSRIIDTEIEPGPVLKTYMINKTGIALDSKKVDELREEGHLKTTQTTIKKLRRMANCQSLSKKAVRAMNPGVLRPSPSKRPTKDPKVTQGTISTSAEVENVHSLEQGNPDPEERGIHREGLLPSATGEEPQGHNQPLDVCRPKGEGDLVARIDHDHVVGEQVGNDVLVSPYRTTPSNEECRSSYGDSIHRVELDHPQVMVFPSPPSKGNQAGGTSPKRGSPRSEGGKTPDRRRGQAADRPRLLAISHPGVVEAVKARKPIKLGDTYKGAILDLSGIETLITPGVQLGLVVNGLIKVVRTRGWATVRVDPMSPLLGEPGLLGGVDDPIYIRHGGKELEDGTVEVVLHHRVDDASPPVKSDAAPKVEMLIEKVTHHDRALGLATVTINLRGKKYQRVVEVPGPSAPATALAAVVAALPGTRPSTVAIRLTGPLNAAGGLDASMKPRQVVFHDAAAVLMTGWIWECRAGWVIGVLR